ncbi:MAG: VCBS repeat-containing protein [Acidobacteria bacterium]|nr:VCBS repeat-containing protein [Acidobacteriota bacterium]
MNSYILRSAFFLLFAAAFPGVIFAQGGLRADLDANFRSYDLVRIDAGSTNLNFRAAAGSVSIELIEHDVRSPDYRAESDGILGRVAVERGKVNTFIGRIDGDASAISRFNRVGNGLEGFFDRGGERFFVEPAKNYSADAAPSQYVIYRLADVRADSFFSCGSIMEKKITDGRSIAFGGENLASVPKRLRIATDADQAYVNTLGSSSAANAEILGILNTIEGVYQQQLGIKISVVYQHTWTTADPFAGTTPEAAVRSFQAYWNSSLPVTEVPRDIAHLFSGKANIQSQGWAFIGVACTSPTYAYGMSGYISWAPGKYLITAHEVGHNLGANHAEVAQGCGSTIMNAQISGATPLEFCTYSRNEVANFVGQNSCLLPSVGCKYDIDGDAKADIGIFRPSVGEWWFLRSGNGSNGAAQFGTGTDKTVPADFTGDGKTDIAIWRETTGSWYILRSEDQTYYAFPFGASGDVPVPEDYDGDGRADAAVYRPSAGTWYVNRSSGGTDIVQFGTAGDVPVPADYDGDGKADAAIFRPSDSAWWLKRSTAGVAAFTFGSAGDRLVPGDYTGDGKADVAIFRPSNGMWAILRSEDGSYYSLPFGLADDMPAPGDYDGDGKFDQAVFRPSNSTWYIQGSSAGTIVKQFGTAGDVPISNGYVR